LKAKNKTAIVIISGSAGELDWIMPILDYLLNNRFKIKIIFLTRLALKSVKKNNMCNEFIKQENSEIDVISVGGYFFEKIERLSYISHRLSLKLKINRIPLINKIYNLYEKILENIFMRVLPSDIKNFKKEKYLFISEFPSLRRPRDIWIRNFFSRSIFFYCPHSPHIYTEELEREYPELDCLDYNKRFFLLLGDPGDYHILNDGRELASANLEKVYIGHPKYSNIWLRNLRKSAMDFRSTYSTRKKINIIVLSRGFGSVIDQEGHINLVETTVKTIHKHIPSYTLLVKKHPRETFSHWDNVINKYSSVEVVTDHISQLAAKADLVVSFWGSGSMDCFALGVPVIEYWDPNKYPKQQVSEKDKFTTIYRKLGIVQSANNKEELQAVLLSLIAGNCKMQLSGPHPFFGKIIKRSNQWDKKIRKILLSHNLINN
jgi:hypothetical protein